jgi:hypothetical protein
MNVQFAINAGLFLQFTYDTWQTGDLDGKTVVTTGGAPVIPGLSYKVKKTLYACGLATDINPTRPLDAGYKTIGIIAVNEKDANDVVIAIRGTSTVWEWIQDCKFFPKPFPNVPGAGLAEDGFTDMYQSFSFRAAANQNPFMQDLLAVIPSTAKVMITGHSLGSSLATLLALDVAAHSNLALSLYTLASPRTGDYTFEQLFNHTVPNAYRIVNRLDIVPKTPPPLLYFHVGDESELIPGSEVSPTIFCWHHLSTYLYLLAKSIGQQAAYPLEGDCKQGTSAAPPSLDEAAGEPG